MSEVINILVGPLGVVVLLVVFMYCFIKEWFVTGPRYKEMKADRDMWREHTLRFSKITARTVGVAEKVVEEHEILEEEVKKNSKSEQQPRTD